MSGNVNSMSGVLIVGAGFTGAIIAAELKRVAGDAGKLLSVTLWDKARGSGGRFTTARCPTNAKCHADVGGQYVSTTENDINKFGRFYTGLRERGLLTDMTAAVEGASPYTGEGVRDMVAPLGMSSLVKHFLATSTASFVSEREVRSIQKTPEGKLNVATISGVTEEFDAVVLTMPVPQILKLQGDFYDQKAFEELTNRNVEYSTRFTLVLFFPDRCDIGLKFGFKFVDNDDVIRYVAVDNIKRGAPRDPAALVVHTTWQFGKDHLEESKEQVEQILLDRVYQMFPELPKTDSRKIHKWRFSQVRSKEAACEGSKTPYFVLNKKPLVLCAGDGFTDSSLNGCLESSTSACRFMESEWKLSPSP
ncbi:Renalase [Hypsibius exemplaris]|uniref:Renalase n=1 Tax=Hypsibius exemplaris TaxID=2072580 RepID=A0A1W0X531_HYPEX|nr:Renalase [Hypsibius exemplaris]